MSGIALSVVAPCFNEERVLPEFLRRMAAVLDGIGGPSRNLTAEIVVIDDGSQDGTWDILKAAATAEPRLVAVRLMRNHGHQLALTAGLTICRGERILVIDADLQDPPELLPDMLKLMEEGADVVYGRRRTRDGESLFKRASAAAFYRLIGRLTDVEIPTDAGDFRLMTRRVLDFLLAMPERHRFVRGMVAWIGGKQVPIAYDRQPRAAGKSKYPLRKMVHFAGDAITAFSVVPLMAAMTIGWVMATIGFGFFVYSIVGWLLGHNLPGWTSLMAAVGLLGGMQFLMLGIIGAYLGRLYDQSKGRPLFMVREIVGGPGGLSGGAGPR
jgi:glycosyltransferase involved in cell wall biosynthesis